MARRRSAWAMTMVIAVALLSVLARAEGVHALTHTPTAPAAWFVFSPMLPEPGQMVQLDASASEGEGGIASYQWDTTGDGFFDRAGQQVSVSFPNAGRYPVTLKVHDRLGRSATVTRIIQVGTGGVHLSIRSHPSDLTVYIDGEDRGRTPLELMVESGVREIRVRHYWMGEWRAELDLRKLTSLSLDISLRGL